MLHIFGSSYSFVLIWLLLFFPKRLQGKGRSLFPVLAGQAGLREQCALTLNLHVGNLLMRMHSQNDRITKVGEDLQDQHHLVYH